MKRRIFGITMLVMLIMMSVVSVSFINRANTTVSSVSPNSSKMELIVKSLILYNYKKEHPKTNYLTFDKSISKAKQKRLEQTFSDHVDDIAAAWMNNDDLYYAFINTKNNKNIVTRLDDTKKPYCFNVMVTYNSKGQAKLKQSKYNEFYSTFSWSDFLENYSEDTAKILGSYQYNKVKVNAPKNMRVIVQIPQQLSTYNMRNRLIGSTYGYNAVVEIMVISALIIMIFTFAYPVVYEAEVEPYKTFKNWYFIINALMIALPVLLIVNFVDSTFFIYSNGTHSMDRSIRFILITCCFMIVYFMVSLFAFGLKYIFKNGFINYLKEHTFIGAIIRWISKTANELTDHELSHTENLQLLEFIALNFFILIIIIATPLLDYIARFVFPWDMDISGEIKLIALIVYSIVFYTFLRKKFVRNKQNYQKLIDQADALSQGDFHEVNDDLGIFNDLRDSMNHVKDGFEAAVKEEVKSTTMKTELISNVSHDLKTPLTCIKNYVVLLKNAPEEDRNQYIAEIENYTNRLSDLIEDLFEVSKVNSGNVKLNKTKLDLVALLDQALFEMEDQLADRQLKVIKKSNVEHAMSELDSEKTYRVFENLLVNISKYAMPGTRVYIDVNVADDIGITFKNISAEEMNFTPDEIVERFVRGDKSRHQSGSGLGLAIAKSFTEVQGGSFELSIDGDMFKVNLHFPQAA